MYRKWVIIFNKVFQKSLTKKMRHEQPHKDGEEATGKGSGATLTKSQVTHLTSKEHNFQNSEATLIVIYACCKIKKEYLAVKTSLAL